MITCERSKTAPSPGIGCINEHSLHASIKEWYARPEDSVEAQVDGHVIDIVRGDLLIEIQTGNFSAIRSKLRRLLGSHRVRLVYPIPERKRIVKVPESGEGVLSRRRSPKKGAPADLFEELVRIPALINEERFELEILMVEEEEVHCDDGAGSWRRKGVSIRDKRLLSVVERRLFRESADFLAFLPEGLDSPFTNRLLCEATGLSIYRTRQMTYSLRRMGAIETVGKQGNALLFDVVA